MTTKAKAAPKAATEPKAKAAPKARDIDEAVENPVAANLDEVAEFGNPLHAYTTFVRKSEVSTIVVTVPPHEAVILESLFGAGNITVDLTTGKPAEIEDAQEEFDRLLRVYGRKGEEAVRLIYPSAGALAEDLGLQAPKRRRGLANEQQGQFSAQRGNTE